MILPKREPSSRAGAAWEEQFRAVDTAYRAWAGFSGAQSKPLTPRVSLAGSHRVSATGFNGRGRYCEHHVQRASRILPNFDKRAKRLLNIENGEFSPKKIIVFNISESNPQQAKCATAMTRGERECERAEEEGEGPGRERGRGQERREIEGETGSTAEAGRGEPNASRL